MLECISVISVARRVASLFFAICLLLAPLAIQASDGKDDGDSYYLDGYDVVSYFLSTGPILGQPKYSTRYKGKLHAFANSDNLEHFIGNPEAFLPAYDGYCAYGMVYGMKSSVDPLLYDIVDGRLYLHIDRGTKKRWNRKITRYIKRSDRIWRKVTSKP